MGKVGKYEFKANIDLNTGSEIETGNVSIFDKEREKFVSIVQVQARDREHFMEIAESIKNAFLMGGEKNE